MGSSKKHKEKDKDRDREKRRDRERKHRERDSNKDRDKDSDKERRRREERAKEKRSHPAEDDERVEKKKAKREEYDDLYEYAVEESTRDDHSNGMVNLDWNACSMFNMLLVRNICSYSSYQPVLKCVYNVRGAWNNVFIPRPCTQAAKRAFNYRGAVMWNGLENVLKDEINLNSFKSALSLP